MKTHYAVINGTTVIDSRSSASRHIDGTGKFGPYTFAAVVEKSDGSIGILQYSGSRALATAAANTWRNRMGGDSGYFAVAEAIRVFVLPVIITPKRCKPGDQVQLPQQQEVGAQ